MTVNQFFRACKNKLTNCQFIYASNSEIIYEGIRPAKLWHNKIFKIEMINKTFTIYVSKEKYEELYDPNDINLHFSDLTDVLNDNIYIFAPIKYINNKNLLINAIYIKDNGCLEIY